MEGFQQGCASQLRLAKEIAEVFAGVENEVKRVLFVNNGRFTVLVIELPNADCQLRALLFRASDGAEHLVQVNLTLRPIPASPRRLVWTAIYEELGLVFAGTNVSVLNDRTFGEFMHSYSSFSEFLQNVLDGVEGVHQPYGTPKEDDAPRNFRKAA